VAATNVEAHRAGHEAFNRRDYDQVSLLTQLGLLQLTGDAA
jgi:hypothetical protein